MTRVEMGLVLAPIGAHSSAYRELVGRKADLTDHHVPEFGAREDLVRPSATITVEHEAIGAAAGWNHQAAGLQLPHEEDDSVVVLGRVHVQIERLCRLDILRRK